MSFGENRANDQSEQQAEKCQAFPQTRAAIVARNRVVRRPLARDRRRLGLRGFRVVCGVAVLCCHERDEARKMSSRVIVAVRPKPVHGKVPGEHDEEEKREMGRAPQSGPSVFPSHVM